MFEREIQFITDFNLNKIKRLGTFFTLDQLKEAGIHPALHQYISAELDDLIYLDRKRLLEKSQFDYSGPVISDHFLKIGEEIKRNKLLPFDICKRLIHAAVTFTTHYLVNPRLTLIKFVFEEEHSREVERLKILLHHSFFYDYYKAIILRLLQKKRSLAVSLDEFKTIIRNIQNEIQKSDPREFVENDLYTIAEFFNIGELHKTKLSCEVVTYYLRGKEMSDAVNKVRAFLSDDLKQKFDVDEFKSVIFSNETAPVFKDNTDDADITQLFGTAPAEVEAKIGYIIIGEDSNDLAEQEKFAPLQEDSEETITLSVEAVQDMAIASVLSDDPDLSLDKHLPEPEVFPETADNSDDEFSRNEYSTEWEEETQIEISLPELPTENEPNEVPGIDESETQLSANDTEQNTLTHEATESADFSSILDELLSDNAPLSTAPHKTGIVEDQSPLAPFIFSSINQDENETALELPEEKVVEIFNENGKEISGDIATSEELPDEELSSISESFLNGENITTDEENSVLPLTEITDTASDSTEEVTEILPIIELNEVDESASEVVENIEEGQFAHTTEPGTKTENSNDLDDDLLSSFSAKESILIIKEIFKNNSVDFVQTIENIGSCDNLMQAQLTLKSLLYAYNINELSNPAQVLNKRVNAYFHAKGK